MPSQEFSIVYGSTTVGGASTDYVLDGPMRIGNDYVTGTVSADVVVVKNPAYTEAQFKTACAALEAAFRVPRQRLQVILGSQTMIDWNPSTDTGFNAEPSCEKVGDDVDTARSRRYRITVKATLPADLSGQNGRRSSITTVEYDASRIRTVTITGEYTAISSTAARAVYTANSPAFFSAVLTALGGTYELIRETPDSDDADKICKFTAVYREIVYAQSGAGLDHTNIVSHTVSFARSFPSPGDSGGGTVRRPETVVVTYDCNVRGTQGLESLWNGTLRPYVIAQFNAKFPNKASAIVSEDPRFEHANQRITASLTFSAIISGDILTLAATMGFEEDAGKRFTGAWTGDKYAHHVDQGFAVVLLTQHVEGTVLGLRAPRRRIDGNSGVGSLFLPGDWNPEGGSGYELISNRPRSTPRWVGQPGQGGYIVTDFVEDCVKRYVTKPKGGGGGGGITPGSGGGGGTVTSPGGAITPGLR